MRRPHRQWWIWSAAPIVVAGLGLVAFCWWHNVWSRNEWLVYRAMEECHPVWRDFLFSRINAGDNVNSVIAQTRPSVVENERGTVTLCWYQNYQEGQLQFTSVYAEARQGKLVCAYAGSCTWTRQFFDLTGREADNFGMQRYVQLPQGGAISIE